MDLSSEAVAVIGFIVLFALMLLRVPVGMAMGLVGVSGFGYITGGGPALKMVGQTSMRIVTDYTFGVIPMFLLMGSVASRTGMSRELFQAANRFVGHWRGGLGIATIAACAGFAAISGSSVATAATFSTVAYPEMRDFGYPKSFATGVIAAGGTLGAMFPPSIVLAVYGLITQQDIGKLFIAGILPGLLAVSMYMATIAIIGAVRPGWLPAARVASWRERYQAVKEVWAPLLLFVFVIGGLYGGLFTPTEAGGMGAGGARFDQRGAAAAVAGRSAGVSAAGDADGGGGFHRADRGDFVWVFPDRYSDATESNCVHYGVGLGTDRRAGADHADVSGAGLPDGRDGDGDPDGADHLSGDYGAGVRSDLVRGDCRHDGGTRVDPSAGRDECVRYQDGGAGCFIQYDLLRGDSVRADGYRSLGDPDRFSGDCYVAAGADVRYPVMRSNRG